MPSSRTYKKSMDIVGQKKVAILWEVDIIVDFLGWWR
jgi:hypothetical protein